MINTDMDVIWDVDGTLVDTAELHYQARCVLARGIGKQFTRDDFNATFGWRNPEIIPKIFGLHGQDDIATLGDRKEILYRAEARKGASVGELFEAGRNVDRQNSGTPCPRRSLIIRQAFIHLRRTVRSSICNNSATSACAQPW
jgi:phosphoglycolate phosphatase-like HAD superfamily hydrolase